MQIIPAILATSEEEYARKLKQIEDSKFNNNWVQIDLMDNKFVQNRSIGPLVIAKYHTNFKIEAQLMVEYPENWIDELVKIPVTRIVFPVEDVEGVDERITHIKNHGIEVGLSINPETDIETLTPFAGKIDVVLIMSVKPGFGGQEFIPETIEKIKKIKSKDWPIQIEVDGGVSKQVMPELENAGADSVVVGSHLWEILSKK